MMMMMLRLSALCLFLSTAWAVPAIVWEHSQTTPETVYTSNEWSPQSLFGGASESLSVVFVLGRQSNGDESLSQLAPFLETNKQPKYVHQHVVGVESISKVASNYDSDAVVVSLDEMDAQLNATSLYETVEVLTTRSDISSVPQRRLPAFENSCFSARSYTAYSSSE